MSVSVHYRKTREGKSSGVCGERALMVEALKRTEGFERVVSFAKVLGYDEERRTLALRIQIEKL
jgi:hypothetical protein